MNRVFLREKSEYDKLENGRKTVCVIGSRFIALALACEAKSRGREKVTFVDFSTDSRIYDALGFDKRFVERTFTDALKIVHEGGNIADVKNIEAGINFIVAMPRIQEVNAAADEGIFQAECLRLLNQAAGDYIIVSLPAFNGYEEIVKSFENLIYVIDPLPSIVLEKEMEIAKIKSLAAQKAGSFYAEKRVIWVINHANAGVNNRQLNHFLNVKEKIFVPQIPIERIYAAEYNCRIPYFDKEIVSILKPSISEIYEKI